MSTTQSAKLLPEQMIVYATLEQLSTIFASCSHTLQLPVYDDKETNRILKKVDFRLLPVLALLYLLAFLDRE